VGNGVVLDMPIMMKELKSLEDAGYTHWKKHSDRFLISNRAHLLFKAHQIIDGSQESALKENNIGTTKKGIGPCYSSKTTRNGVRVGDLVSDDPELFKQKYTTLIQSLQRQYNFEYDLNEELDRFKLYREFLKNHVTDTVYMVNDAILNGKTLLAEGANAALLDLDMGTYPYVTSSSTVAGGICTGLGIAPTRIGNVIGVAKAYLTRVGEGPMATELDNEIGKRMRDVGGEYGVTTGRPRRCGWIDLVALQYAQRINQFATLNLTKLDVLSGFDEVKVCVAYKYKGNVLPSFPGSLEILKDVEPVYESFPGWKEDISKCRKFTDLPENARKYVRFLEEKVGVGAKYIGVGPGREGMIVQN